MVFGRAGAGCTWPDGEERGVNKSGSSQTGVPNWRGLYGRVFGVIGAMVAGTRLGVTEVQLRDRGLFSSAASVKAVAGVRAMNSAIASNMMVRLAASVGKASSQGIVTVGAGDAPLRIEFDPR